MAVEFPAGEDRLSPGRQRATVAEVESLLVTGFPTSRTRRPLFDRWVAVREAIRRIVSVQSEWLNGSYVTTKENPGDIDMVTILDPAEVEGLDAASQAMLKGLVAGNASKNLHMCHSFVIVAYPQGHPAHGVYQQNLQYWSALFGHDREGRPKGYLEID